MAYKPNLNAGARRNITKGVVTPADLLKPAKPIRAIVAKVSGADTPVSIRRPPEKRQFRDIRAEASRYTLPTPRSLLQAQGEEPDIAGFQGVRQPTAPTPFEQDIGSPFAGYKARPLVTPPAAPRAAGPTPAESDIASSFAGYKTPPERTAALEAERKANEPPKFDNPLEQKMWDTLYSYMAAGDTKGGFGTAATEIMGNLSDFLQNDLTPPGDLDIPEKPTDPLSIKPGDPWWYATDTGQIYATEQQIVARQQHIADLNNYANALSGGINAIFGAQINSFTAVSNVLLSMMAVEETRTGRTIGVEQAVLERENAYNIAKLGTDTTRDVAQNQINANIALQEKELEFLGKENQLNRDIQSGQLEEVVRSNKELERLGRERLALEQDVARNDFLYNMLLDGGLGFFTLALMSPDAAQSLFASLTGQQASEAGGPLAAAMGFRGQQQQFGQYATPSAQQYARQTPLERLYGQTAFAGVGRSYEEDIERLTPFSVGNVARR